MNKNRRAYLNTANGSDNFLVLASIEIRNYGKNRGHMHKKSYIWVSGLNIEFWSVLCVVHLRKLNVLELFMKTNLRECTREWTDTLFFCRAWQFLIQNLHVLMTYITKVLSIRSMCNHWKFILEYTEMCKKKTLKKHNKCLANPEFLFVFMWWIWCHSIHC